MNHKEENMNDVPLDYSDKIMMYHIAVNPDDTGEEVMNAMGLNTRKYSEMVDKLMDKELVSMNEGEAPIWRITGLGQLMLEKFVNNKKYDLLYAKKKENVGPAVVEKLQKDKLMFERALNACRGRKSYNERTEDGSQ